MEGRYSRSQSQNIFEDIHITSDELVPKHTFSSQADSLSSHTYTVLILLPENYPYNKAQGRKSQK